MKHIRQKHNISSFSSLRLNYWGIPKCANTTLKYALLRAENPNLVERMESKKRNKNTNVDGNPNRGWVHQKCQYITPQEAQHNGHKNFTALRDPVQRACSMYQNGLSRPERVTASGSDQFKRDITALFKKYRNRPSMLDFLDVIKQYSDNQRNIHYRSQKSYCLINKIIKLDVALLSSTAHLVHPKLIIDIKLNESKDKPTPSVEVLDRIHKVFAADFDLWNQCIS